MSSSSSSSSSNSGGSRRGKGPPKSSLGLTPHMTIAAIPKLDSAPSSGNAIPPRDPLSATLPPPPPPPPRSRGTASRSVTPPRSNRSSGGAGAAAVGTGTVTPLPPPPQISTTSTARTTAGGEVENKGEVQQQPSGPPTYLPITTFAPKALQVLARRQTHIPILVVSTEEANKLAWKNNLQLVDMFQGIVHDLRLGQPLPPFRSIYKSLSLSDSSVKIQFLEPAHMEPFEYNDAHELLSEHAKLQDADGNVAQELVLLEDRVDELLQDRHNKRNMAPGDKESETLEDVTKEAYQLTSPLDIPWLLRYRQALDTSTNSLPHDLINCPPLALLVCTTQEIEPPQQVLQELFNSPLVLPGAFKNGLYDPTAMRQEVLVLHDAVEGPTKTFDEAKLRQSLQAQFGPNASILRINSVLPETARALAEQEETDLWGGKGSKGNCLSVNDRVLLRRYFQTLITASLLPALERRIADLNAIVSERKKGVRNLVKSFWRKPKEETPNVTIGNNTPGKLGDTSVKYRYDSIESQTRLLADTLFLMQDFDAALSTYRLIRDDYRSDKALTHYASVQEMMALCMYHMDPYTRAKEIFAHLETALLSYTRAAEEERNKWSNDPAARPTTAPHPTRLATRLCLLVATAVDSLTKGRELEVADLLASASSHESSLGAAVLLEQASAFYYHASMNRKYAFHMLMSGHMFRTAGQDHHAFRCFTSALYVYRHGRWTELHNHLRSALAAQLYSMGRMSVALVLYAKLVGTAGGGKVSSKSQQKFLHHLLEICEDHAKPALAGADRMAAPPDIPSNERESFRNAQLGRIVNVIRYTKGASRVLELPYINLPHILDSSVRIWTHAEEHFVRGDTASETQDETEQVEQSISTHFGKASKGRESEWVDLQLMATAELGTVDSAKSQADETMTEVLSRIKDVDHRNLIARVDREKANRSMAERSKRTGTAKPTPTVRSKGEPLFCDFVVKNPLSVEISITEVQLVARLVNKEGTTCTNQDAIRIRTLVEGDAQTSWNFASTDHLEFVVPDFARSFEANQKACKSAKYDPYFVVTKARVELAAGEEKVVSVGLTPLTEGDLEIIGVRCKLFDKVWLYHPFDIKGPLLNNTRTNRANRARGESVLLKSKIESDMPCLTAELIKRLPNRSPSSGDGGPLLEGQVSSWTVQLRNVGTAPATSVVLKTNLPWVRIGSSSESNVGTAEQKEAQACSRCLGPTGTLLSVPIEGDNIQTPGIIHPGETCEVAIQIRTSGDGKHEFYMLYRYELWQDPNTTSTTDVGAISPSSPTRHRWLRKMYEVPVFPSLSLNAKIGASWWTGSEEMLSVELTNNRTDRPTDLYLTLDSLSLVSRHYSLEPLPGQFSTSAELGNVLQIGWQERMTVHYRVVPHKEASKVCLLSECPFTEKSQSISKKCVDSDATDYLRLERASESFEAAWKLHQYDLARAEHAEHGEGKHPRSIASIRRANTTESIDSADSDPSETMHATSIGRLCPSVSNGGSVHILCSWRAILGDEVIHGQHCLRGVSVRPLAQYNGCPVTATASHPSIVTHNFTKGPAIVPAKISLRNRLLESTVDFSVTVENSPMFELIGLDKLKLSLGPGESIDIPSEVLIPSPGMHNLQCLHLTIQRGEEELSYRLQQQWLINLVQKG